jgi:hypothetical protein
MKKGFGILLVLLLMTLQPVVFALPQNQPRVEQLKTRLSKVSGKEKIKVLAELIDALGTNAPSLVIQYGQQALKLLEKSPDPSSELGILNDICWNYHILGDYKQVLQ